MDIRELYNDVVQDGEKTASAADTKTETEAAETEKEAGFEINSDFFEKVASGSPAETQYLDTLINEARAEGASDEDIEGILSEAIENSTKTASAESEETETETGDTENVETEDDFETQKLAAYEQGVEKAIADALESETAKTAGVTFEDLAQAELGKIYGQGYADTMPVAKETIEKIAEIKMAKGAMGLVRKLKGMGPKAKAMGKDLAAKMKSDKAKGLAALAATPAAAGLGAYAGSKSAKEGE